MYRYCTCLFMASCAEIYHLSDPEPDCCQFQSIAPGVFSIRDTEIIPNELSRFLWNRCRQFRFFCESWYFFGELYFVCIDSVNVRWRGAWPTWKSCSTCAATAACSEFWIAEKDCTSMSTSKLTPCFLSIDYLYWNVDFNPSISSMHAVVFFWIGFYQTNRNFYRFCFPPDFSQCHPIS